MEIEHPTDLRRKKLLYRAMHRGTKEADVIIGGYFQDRLGTLPDAALAEAEEFLELLDLDVLDWIMGRQPIPDRWKGSLLDDLLAWQRAREGV